MSDAPIFTTGALEIVRELALHGTNINRIRTSLFKSEGVWFKNDDIIAAGREFGFEIVPVPSGSHVYDAQRQPHVTMRETRAPADKVRLVPKGTFAVPKGGFRIGVRHGRP